MKRVKFFMIAALALTSLCNIAAKDSVEDAYNLYSPDSKTTRIWIQISGETRSDRISFQKGKNPLVVKDEDGKLMEKDPNYETTYAILNFWGNEDSRAFNLAAWKDVPDGKWVKIVITFIPRKSGKVRLEVGPTLSKQFYPDKTFYKYADLGYSRYAKLTAVNAKFKDPDFKKPKMWGLQKYYYFNDIKSEFIDDPEAPGGKCLRAIGRIKQEVSVKANVPVTITFYYRSDDYFKAKK